MNPTISWWLNLGDDDTPIWQEVTDNLYFYFTGPDTTTKEDQLTPPTFVERKWAEELWLAESGFENASQCKIFVSPDDIRQAVNILKVTFTNDSASNIKLSAYDNNSQNSTNEQIFSNVPWLKAVETTDNSQPTQNWINYTSTVSNGSTINVLKGDTNYVECATNVNAENSKYFALACALPNNAETIGHNWTFSISYDYTS